MVDGVDIGVDMMRKDSKENLFCQLFRNADMVCIVPEEYESNLRAGKDKAYMGFTIYGIYGSNKIVTSFVPSTWVSALISDNKDKVILVNKKPYLLNGESIAS